MARNSAFPVVSSTQIRSMVEGFSRLLGRPAWKHCGVHRSFPPCCQFRSRISCSRTRRGIRGACSIHFRGPIHSLRTMRFALALDRDVHPSSGHLDASVLESNHMSGLPPVTGAPPNYALERSVKGWQERAAGARTIIAPAARVSRLARPAQRGR